MTAEIWVPPSEFDEYTLVRMLGKGGMGQVFLARDVLLERNVAIKFLSRADPDPLDRERFLIEARAAARLDHPNVVRIHRIGELEGHPFIVSEHVEGAALDHRKQTLPTDRLLRVGIGLCRALVAAHRAGILHRDVKPSNVIVTAQGDAKLADFGIAKLFDGALAEVGPALTGTPASMELTDPSIVLGTPYYIAPEIWAGEPASVKTDLYALGAVLYAMAAGRVPFEGLTFRELSDVVGVIDADPVLVHAPELDPRVAALIDRCVCRLPDERFASVADLLVQLEGLRRGAAGSSQDNPYRGLQAFQGEHRLLFFGRDAEVQGVLELLRTRGLVVVAGDSGVGKSSLCRAGVLPDVLAGALEGGRRWACVTVVPGARPAEALADAIATQLGLEPVALLEQILAEPAQACRVVQRAVPPDAGLLVFVDQLEELVSVAEPGQAMQVARFLTELGGVARAFRVLATVRGDFLTRLAALPGLGPALPPSLHLLAPLSAEGIREAIVGPAAARGVHFETDAMVDRLVEATQRAQGALPLLQFALAQLWRVRDEARGVITADALDTIGGVSGALARHADATLGALSPDAYRAARRAFLRLVTLAGTRARRTEPELGADRADTREALAALVQARLLVASGEGGQNAYEVAHEALIGGWPTLRNWLEDAAESRAHRERLETAAQTWLRLGRPRDVLWRAAELAELGELDDEPSEAERSFLSASRRSVGRRRWQLRVAVAAVPLVVLGALGAAELRSRRERDAVIAGQVKSATGATSRALAAAARGEDRRRQVASLYEARKGEEAEVAWSEVLSSERDAEAGFREALRLLQAGLDLDPRAGAVRASLAAVLDSAAALAERAGREDDVHDRVERMSLYDPGGVRVAAWRAPARLSITTEPRTAAVRVARYDRLPGRAWPLVEARDVGPTPLQLELRAGSYLVELSAPDRTPVRLPLLLRRGEALAIEQRLPAADEVPPGFVYVPPGRFRFGSRADEGLRREFFRAQPEATRETGGFAIARREVTFEEWIAYLRDQPSEVPKRLPHASGAGFKGAVVLELGDAPRLTIQAGSARHRSVDERITFDGRKGVAQSWRRLPVVGVSWDDALAYSAWLDRTGRVRGARPCTELEWERAARGADGRVFPHGESLAPQDANFDETHGREGIGPDEVGSHPASRSPFGVDDLAGNVWEMTAPVLGGSEPVMRGGSFAFARGASQAVNREPVEAGFRDVAVGLRICASR